MCANNRKHFYCSITTDTVLILKSLKITRNMYKISSFRNLIDTDGI